jgi:hypothetical protein
MLMIADPVSSDDNHKRVIGILVQREPFTVLTAGTAVPLLILTRAKD